MDGSTPLIAAARNNCPTVVKALLADERVDVDATDVSLARLVVDNSWNLQVTGVSELIPLDSVQCLGLFVTGPVVPSLARSGGAPIGWEHVLTLS